MAVLDSTSLRTAINSADSQASVTGTATLPVTLPSSSVSSQVLNNQDVYVQAEQTNPLNDYDSYTYCLSLHLLSIDEYNTLMSGTETVDGVVKEGKIYYPQNVLVSSAGRYARDFVRNRNFTEDFYFDNFKMTTVINTTTRNRSTNLVECSFTLIEPLGFTFINRLIAAANETNGATSYLQMPFVIQIDFFGFKDGDVVEPNGIKTVRVGDNFVNPGPLNGMTKIIPIKLTDLKSRITTRGTEYSIQAVPYNHHAFNQIYVTSPAAFTIAAKTVQEVFGSGTADQNTATAANQRTELQLERQRLAAVAASPGNDGRGGFGIANSQSQLAAIDKQLAALPTNLQSTGYADGVNGWYKGLEAQRSTQTIDSIAVVFDDEIANATLYPTTGPINTAQATSNNNAKTTAQSAAGQTKGQIDFHSGKISIPAGMTIDKLIDWAVRNSSYIGNQLSDPTSGKNLNINADRAKPLNWYKIVPRIIINSFDPSTNRYSLAITYYVKTWTLSAHHPFAPQGRAPGFVKEYAWFYTGQNKDVLDMQIDFDLLYFNELQAFRNKTKITDTAKNLGESPSFRQAGDGNPDTGQAVDAGSVDVPKYRRVSPVATSYVSSRYMQGRAGADQSDSATAADVQKSFTLSARGDMVNLKLKIVGDPHFIKQDDFFYMGRGSGKDTNSLTDNNSLWMDNGELYVRVLFDTPADYDETIGLAIPGNSPYSKNEFSGIYKLITVSNEFTRGKFEQILDLVMITIEEASNSTRDNAIQRIESLVLQNYSAKGFNAGRFSGPSIIQNSLTGGGGIGVGASQAAGSSSGGGLLNSLVAQGQQVLTGAVNKAVGDITKPLTDKATAYAKDVFGKLKDSLGFGGTSSSTLGGGGGADGTAQSGTETAQHTPEPSAMNQASENWNSDSADAQPAVENADNVPLNDYAGVDGATDVQIADVDLGGDIGGIDVGFG
jgi:hypothetical protein